MTVATVVGAAFEARIRRSPFFDATLRHGARDFSIYNHMYFPGNFGTAEENYWNLVTNANLADVGVERQVEVSGSDASRFVQLLTPRNLSNCSAGQCKYVVLTSAEGGIISDAVLLRLERDRYWLSVADSDVLLWAKGVQTFAGMDVAVTEPDVAPIQLQGPKSGAIMRALVGDELADLRYYWLRELMINDIPVVVSRTGYSGEFGYEIFLCDCTKADLLWETLMEAGRPFALRADTTSGIRRIEAGILVYQQDMTIANNPFEIGLHRLVDLDAGFDFIGKQALTVIRDEGAAMASCGIEITGEPLALRNSYPWEMSIGDTYVGRATSCIYSLMLKKNIGLAMVTTPYSRIGTCLTVLTAAGRREAIVVPTPFYDPEKKLARGLVSDAR